MNEGQDIRKQEPRDKDDEWDEGVKTSTRSICPMHRLFSYLHFHHISIVGNLISCVSMLVSPLPVLSFPFLSPVVSLIIRLPSLSLRSLVFH